MLAFLIPYYHAGNTAFVSFVQKHFEGTITLPIGEYQNGNCCHEIGTYWSKKRSGSPFLTFLVQMQSYQMVTL